MDALKRLPEDAARLQKHPASTSRLFFVFFLAFLAAASWLGGARPPGLGGALHSSFYGDEITDGAEFEFVVVGAGAAGCAVAARLVQAGRRVLLVEAGGDAGLLAQMPGSFLSLTGSNLDWAYDTLPNNISCLAAKGETCRIAAGKCLGGSTCINSLMYTRGNRDDYNYNFPGWSWEDIEPYFLRFEGFEDSKLLPESSKRYHNTSGTVQLEYFGEYKSSWYHRILKGFQSLNFSHNLDTIGESQIGISKIPGFVSGGERVTMAKAYLDREDVKSGLTVAKNTKCTGVIIDDDNVARGVILTQGNNQTVSVFSNKEVILSAGAIGTVQLLLLSGVGPKKDLDQLEIPVKADLPVGEDMSDHVISLIYVKVNNESKLTVLTMAEKVMQTVQWLATRSGPMTSINLSDVTLFVNTKCYDFKQKYLTNNASLCELPTTQYIFYYIDKGILRFVAPVFNRVTRYIDKVREQVSAANDESTLLVMSLVVLQPESRGWIRLASSDPSKPPLIMPNYLSDERDVEEMVRALRILEDVLEMPFYRGYNASILRLRLPGCDELSDEYWACYVRYISQSTHHTVGVAALGNVLDERLRVRGVRHLRVADAAALPRLPRGNTAAAVIALGERLSDFLLQDHGLPSYIDRYHQVKAKQEPDLDERDNLS